MNHFFYFVSSFIFLGIGDEPEDRARRLDQAAEVVPHPGQDGGGGGGDARRDQLAHSK